MELWNEARVALYGGLQRRLPASVRTWIGRSQLTASLRRWLLWPRGLGTLVESQISFHGCEFRFAAPVKVASTVRQRGGIESGLCRLVLQECGAGAVAIDVGASYGFISLVMASAVGPSGRVYAFEADPAIADALRANILMNGLETRCTTVQGFVGSIADGRTRLTLDEYVAARGVDRVDFLKIDVDGPDLEVLRGARDCLAQFHPVVVIEMTCGQPEIVDLLEQLGYECSDMSGRAINSTRWPPNMLAAVGRRLKVPSRDDLRSRAF